MLTPKQAETLGFIAAYMARHDGRAPSFREIAAGTGAGGKQAVFERLGALEERGFIRRVRYRRCSIELLRLPAELDFTTQLWRRQRILAIDPERPDLAPNEAAALRAVAERLCAPLAAAAE